MAKPRGPSYSGNVNAVLEGRIEEALDRVGKLRISSNKSLK